MTATFRESTFDHEEAVKLWRAYSTATRELSFALCESLRLILEPTLATKMRGDYRTGKRLNMRKVIPYIASEFKKDKIWLRRTKPSKRTYQILIAIDDSRSMAESQSVELAYESIALITKAFEQLEVGQVAVASFGGNMQLLHHFETPLSDDAGGKIFEKFTFDQTSTNVLQLMDSSIKMLSDARNFAANTGRDMWQLEIVLSDGIMDNHKNVRQFVRVAMQKQIMTVFIVLDRRNERDSILKMSSVSYETDASGRPSLKMTPYISTFPFDFFIVLQDISQLPNVLSETLRQYLQVTSS
ncbi:hypothetical protein DFJ73DRAFT_619347 [Zopfochytrium polystomum]|nr:hypothetical protein DFJ73DRAFT_619347 [Zopfochytrium polystomum]